MFLDDELAVLKEQDCVLYNFCVDYRSLVNNIPKSCDDVHRSYLRDAYDYGFAYSRDKSTKNGALLLVNEQVAVYGTNGLLTQIKDVPERHERPLKYHYLIHAEQDCILKAASKGIRTEGSVLYVPWFACSECAKSIIISGVRKVVGHEKVMLMTPARWVEPIVHALKMLNEAGVELLLYKGNIGGVDGFFDGKHWSP